MGYQIGGRALNVKPEVLVNVLLPIFPELKHRPRVYGYDIELNRNNLEFHLNSLDEVDYSLEATFYGTEDQLLSLLTLLKNAFLSIELKFYIWYCEEDNDGNTLSDETI